jgi:hypothetical protein
LSTEIYWQDNGPLVLSSYVVKTASGKKNVLLLSTVPPILGKTKDDTRCKTGLYKLYDFTKGGTDIVDQRMGFHTCKPKSRKWTMVAFSYLLDMARVNSATIHALNKGIDPCIINSFDFIHDLVNELVTPHIKQRDQTRLRWSIKNKIELIIGKTVVAEQRQEAGPAISQRRGRCHICLLQIVGDGHRQRKDHVNSQKS